MIVTIRFFIKCILCWKSCLGYYRSFDLFLNRKFKIGFTVGTQYGFSDSIAFDKIFRTSRIGSVCHTQVGRVCRRRRLYSCWFFRLYGLNGGFDYPCRRFDVNLYLCHGTLGLSLDYGFAFR
jgi:hypothetical protein